MAILIFFLLSYPVKEDTGRVYMMDPIVVTATRAPVRFSQLTRNVIVIDSNTIQHTPVSSVGELLQYVLDLRPRGVTQADASIRGATFEQVLILIDGMKVNDPQTGHHNLDIPLVLEDIERIEILYGHSSSLYGPDAFGGVVNVITKPQRSKMIKAAVGDYETWEGSVSYPYGWKNYLGSLSLETRKSQGWRYDTDFDILTLSHHSTMRFSQGSLALFLGYLDKDFGANDFYGPSHSWETTKTEFAGLTVRSKYIESRAYYRKHYDKYIVDITDPNSQVNSHTTYIYGGEAESHFSTGKAGSFVFGGEALREMIRGDKLGNWENQRGGVFSEWHLFFNRFMFNSNIRLDYHSNYGWSWYPSVDVGYLITPLKVRTSIGRSFRTPSYTELFYFDPHNIGNPELKPEESWSYEVGLDWLLAEYSGARATLFLRNGKNLIDWARETEDGYWEAFNGDGKTTGIELSLRLSYISMGYTFTKTRLEPKVAISKYLLNHPEHQVNLSLSAPVGLGFHSSLQAYYKKKVGDEGYYILDGCFSRKFRCIEIFVSGTNLLNSDYEENQGVPMPGRWVKTGIVLNL